jgi:hypothetical protein
MTDDKNPFITDGIEEAEVIPSLKKKESQTKDLKILPEKIKQSPEKKRSLLDVLSYDWYR